MPEDATAESRPTLVQRIPNSVIVLLIVALLLQGPVGAFSALCSYTKSLAQTLLGGEDLFIDVICQTAPLTLAVAAIALAYRSEWLTFRTGSSLILSSVILLTATWLGGQLRSFTASRRPASKVVAEVTVLNDSVPKDVGPSSRGVTLLNASYQNPNLTNNLSSLDDWETQQTEPEPVLSVDQALERWLDFRAVATDGSRHDWGQPIPRVTLLPEPNTLIGLVSKAINQLLGYVALYRPRLFVAAVLLGIYIGWSWQPHCQPLLSWLSRRQTNPAEST